MKANYKTLNQCRACHSADLQDAIDFGETAIADDYFREKDNKHTYPLCAALCQSCGLLQLRHAIDPGAIYDDYIYNTSSSPGLRQHFAAYADEVFQQLQLDQNSRVLDIGCNDGVLLEAFEQLGCQIAGVEPSLHTTQALRDRGVTVFTGYWGDELSAEVSSHLGDIDVITANNMFANVDDIQSFTKSVAAALADTGVFVIETGSHLALIENFVFDNIYHEHLSYFSISALNHFFAQFGMEVFYASKVNTKGGSIRLMAGFKGMHNIAPQLSALIQEELDAGLFELNTYRNYMQRISTLKDEVHQKLDTLKHDQVKVIGFGASATCTTVIYVLGLAPYLSYLVDDNPVKHNSYSPGYRIPVKSSEALQQDPGACVVILPWRFGDMFIQANPGHLERGGSYLKIIPALEWIKA